MRADLEACSYIKDVLKMSLVIGGQGSVVVVNTTNILNGLRRRRLASRGRARKAEAKARGDEESDADASAGDDDEDEIEEPLEDEEARGEVKDKEPNVAHELNSDLVTVLDAANAERDRQEAADHAEGDDDDYDDIETGVDEAEDEGQRLADQRAEEEAMETEGEPDEV